MKSDISNLLALVESDSQRGIAQAGKDIREYIEELEAHVANVIADAEDSANMSGKFTGGETLVTWKSINALRYAMEP